MNLDTAIVEISKTNMKGSTYKTSGTLAKELEDELMKFTANYEECKINTDVVEQDKEANMSTSVEVDIAECTKSGGRELFEADYGDVTESSSSFGNSGAEFESVDQLGDSEITSKFCPNTVSVLNSDGCSEPIRLRKRKLTNHWRSFIEPLMWRCKWTELQILKFDSQARKYDKQLEDHNQIKKVRLQNCMSESQGAKSCQFSLKNTRSDLHSRMKRKRTEETVDIVQYMSQHNLFSYYENKKYLTRGLCRDDELKNRAISIQKVHVDDEVWMNDEQSLLESRDGDNSLELLLGKIELLRSQTVELKIRIEKVLCEEAGKFPSIDETSFLTPVQAPTSSSQNTPSKHGDRMSLRTFVASQLVSEQNVDDALVPENALTSPGKMLPEARLCFDETFIKGENEVLIDNKRVKEEMNSLEEVKIQSGSTSLMPKDELHTSTNTMEVPINSQPLPKMRSISNLPTTPKPRRKGRKRRGAGRRGRKSTS